VPPKPRQPSARRLYSQYLYECKRRNIFWGLTQEEVGAITRKDCVYCGQTPAQVIRGYTYNGIDRKDNKQGYTPANVVACCKRCNQIKSDHLSFHEMRRVGRVLASLKKRGRAR
jgi:5-methylcytosine-specific restriction endonuclease McrA